MIINLNVYYYYLKTAGVSEDSDYTSDVSYPTVQHPSASVHHPNSSASQYGGAAEISRRASEYSPHRHGGDARQVQLSCFIEKFSDVNLDAIIYILFLISADD